MNGCGKGLRSEGAVELDLPNNVSERLVTSTLHDVE